MTPQAVSRLGVNMTPLAYNSFNLKNADNRFAFVEKRVNRTHQSVLEKKATKSTPLQKETIVRKTYHLPHASPEVEALIARYATAYSVPEALVRRVVLRESGGNPAARNGPYWGLMQISYPTAVGMGYSGKPSGLLDAETNLRYAVKYLAGAYLVAGGDHGRSVRLYARGYYYDAKSKGLLEETGLRKGPASIKTAFVSE